MRNDFTNGLGQRRKKTNNIANQSGPTKQSFQTCGKKNNSVSDLGNNKCKCANKIYLSVYTTGL